MDKVLHHLLFFFFFCVRAIRQGDTTTAMVA